MYLQETSYSGLSTKFDKFRQRIELTQNQRDKIKASHKHLRESILQPLDYVSNTFLTGSYKKKTLINPANDIDVFVVLRGYTQYDIKPNTILDNLKKELQKTYPNTTIKQNKPCIVIEFQHVVFELTPAIEVESWSTHNSFYIPEMSKNNTWQSVENPRVLESNLTEANKRLDQKLNPLIKMMKKCKIKNNLKTPSFEMEKMAINSLYSINGFRDGVQKLLETYNWYRYDEIIKIKNKSDTEFATFCRDALFGYDFPKD
jgi:predicted nucleotidyltransferase